MPVFMEFLETRPVPEIASRFYQHPYGGIARDTWVTKEQFCRFFELTEHFVDGFPLHMKVMDVIGDFTECLGYKTLNFKTKVEKFRITIVDSSHSRVGHLVRIAPYLWEEDHEPWFATPN